MFDSLLPLIILGLYIQWYWCLSHLKLEQLPSWYYKCNQLKKCKRIGVMLSQLHWLYNVDRKGDSKNIQGVLGGMCHTLGNVP